MRWPSVLIALALALSLATPAMAQDSVPIGEDEPVRSMGFPPTIKPYFAATIDWDRRGAEAAPSGHFVIGAYRDILGPVTGLLGVSAEAYLRPNAEKLDYGGRILATVPLISLGLGGDYSARDSRFDFVLSGSFHLRRGGVFGSGTSFRFDWIPARGHYLAFGFQVPFGQPYSGRTRPLRASVDLPSPRAFELAAHDPDPATQQALVELDHAADWINRMTTPFFDVDIEAPSAEELDQFSQRIGVFKDHMAERDSRYPEGHTFSAEIAAYHDAMEGLVSAAGRLDRGTELHGEVVAQFRRHILDGVLVPYNGLLGQLKRRDTLRGFGVTAIGNLQAWLDSRDEFREPQRRGLVWALGRVIEVLDSHRDGSREIWRDSRFVWLPLHWALREEDHDTQAEIDAIIEKATGEDFTDGNQTYYLVNEQFQGELARTIRAARDYHVLWVHDYRGRNDVGEPDQVSFAMTQVYLEALIDAVERHGDGAPIPRFMIFLDQHYYEITRGKRWLALLADPMRHRVELPAGYETWERRLGELQERLRVAVNESASLRERAARYGGSWLRHQVKVHVSVTNPADFAFRARHVIRPIPFIPDNVMRDHRKIAFYDVTEADPDRGEAIFTGTGVGEHYAGSQWEDRAILIQGPSLVSLKRAAAGLLRSQGYEEHEVPAPLRPLPFPSNYDAMVAARVAEGALGRSMGLHNATGFGPKQVTVLKAVLYDLMPARSVMVAPDPIWNGPLWASLMSGAALRGVRVFPIAPAAENTPSSANFTLSRNNEILSQMVLVGERLGSEIDAAGGMLRVGIYAIDIDVSDVEQRIQAALEDDSSDFLDEVFGFNEDAGQAYVDALDRIRELDLQRTPLVGDVRQRRSMLHLKAQLFLSEQAIGGLARLDSWPPVVENFLVELARQSAIGTEYTPATELGRRLLEVGQPLIGEWYDRLTPEEEEQVVAYFALGSHNQDYRSAMMDGEVTHLDTREAGIIIPMLDYFILMSQSHWVEDVEELREYLPAFTGIWRAVGRWIKNAI